MCIKLAQELSQFMTAEATLCEFPREPPPVLLILDRWDDPVTPLLTQWTYEAMVHELLGISNNRVNLRKSREEREKEKEAAGAAAAAEPIKGDKDLDEIVFSVEGDSFLQDNVYANFGEVGNALRKLVDTFQLKHKGHERIETIDDIKNFISSYPEFRAMSTTVSKHVTLVGELSRIAESRNLFDLSEVEQQIACQTGHDETLKRIKDVLVDQKLSPYHRAKLVLLYAIRYERRGQGGPPRPGMAAPRGNSLADLMNTLQMLYTEEKYRDLIPMAMSLVGASAGARMSDLFGDRKPMSIIKKKLGGLKGVENIYTQHSPLLMSTLDQLLKGRLPEKSFPIVDRNNLRPREVYIFMVGGSTYEEARAIDLFNKSNSEVKVFLGGNVIHNSRSFLEDLKFVSNTAAKPGF